MMSQLVMSISSLGQMYVTPFPYTGRASVSWTPLLLPRTDLSWICHIGSADFCLREPSEKRLHKEIVRGRDRQTDKQRGKKSRKPARELKCKQAKCITAEIEHSQLSSGQQVDCPINTNPLWAWFIGSCSLFNHRKAAGERHLPPHLMKRLPY
jgi:hypothetical protein